MAGMVIIMTVGQDALRVRDVARACEEFVRALTTTAEISTGYEPVARSLRDMVGITASALVGQADGRVTAVVAIPPELAVLERAVGVAGTSPALTAGRSHAAVHCSDVTASPVLEALYVEAAQTLGIRAVAALPLVVGGHSFGALCLYSESVRTWSEEDLAVAGLVAELVASHLHHARELDGQRILSGQLQTALNTRIVIEQAKGVLAASQNIDVQEAFERMRHQARGTNTKLATVAVQIIADGVGPQRGDAEARDR